MIVDCFTCDNRFDLGFMNDIEMQCHGCGVPFASRWRFINKLEREYRGYKFLDFCPTMSDGLEMIDEQIKDYILRATQEQLLLVTGKENLLIIRGFFIDDRPVTRWVAVLGKEGAMAYKPKKAGNGR